MRKRIPANLFLILFSVYLLSSSGFNLYSTVDGMVRYHILENLASSGELNVPDRFGAGGYAVKGRDGKFYDPHELSDIWLLFPVYWIGQHVGGKQFLISLVSPLALAVASVLFFHFCRALGYHEKTSIVLTLILGLCTQFWPESKSPFNHGLETLLILSAIYCCHAYFQGGYLLRLSWCGGLLGLAVLTRTPAVLMLGIVAGLIGYRWQRLRLVEEGSGRKAILAGIVFLSSFLPLFCINLWYNYYRFGDPFTTGFAYWAEVHRTDNFSNPLWKGILGLLISPGKGLFIYCPILLLCLCYCKQFYRRQRELTLLLGCVSVCYILLWGKYINWHGDCGWGPRYFTFLIPFLVMPLGEFLESQFGKRQQIWKSITLVSALAVSLGIQFMGVCIDMNLHFFRAQSAGILRPGAMPHEFPDAFYFSPINSALVSRVYEIKDAIGESQRQERTRTRGNAVFEAVRMEGLHQPTPEFDFWWIPGIRDGKKPAFLLVCVFTFEIALSGLRLVKALRFSL